jgi:hypothetical protein
MPARMSETPDEEDAAPPKGDPIAGEILAAVAALPAGKSLSPEAIARMVAEGRHKAAGKSEAVPANAWRRYLHPVKQQALNLARQGRITILRKGKPADPHAPIKGVIRISAV